jgi:gliding motility-associated-like protein
VNPGATEICDGLDNDCDGLVDDDDPDVTGQTTWYLDSDADGFGDFSNSVVSCNQPSGYVADNTDCDDTNAAVNPTATEVCNGIDDDCDGLVDDADSDITGQSIWYLDNDSDGFGDPTNFVLSCNQPNGYVPDSTDCDDTNANVFPGATEVCDGVDNNCDGQIDESGGTVWYVDADADGYGDVNDTGVTSCTQPPGTVDNNGDCDDANSSVNPGAIEICDGIDNNCDGIIEEPTIQGLPNQEAIGSFTLPIIVGAFLSGNEAYYTGPGGTGTIYMAGDTISFEDFAAYPVTLYIYDSYVTSGCWSEESFDLIINLPLGCTALNQPVFGYSDISVETDLSWDAVEGATGYTIYVGTSSGNYNMVNGEDVGNQLSYEFQEDLPYNTSIFIKIVPYNDREEATNCGEIRFITEGKEEPPKFFTPNGDGYNDFWLVPDKDRLISVIYILDRYGKLLTSLSGTNMAWDGIYNNQLMPTNDYWYVIEYKNGETLRGHFTLKR